MLCKVCNKDSFGLRGEGTGEYCNESILTYIESNFTVRPHKFETDEEVTFS